MLIIANFTSVNRHVQAVNYILNFIDCLNGEYLCR